ncbi:Similar to Fra10ac1: Protein FRA10AC1 homolog (Mus musculus) [Cotesia congregata]|uniref:Similar to Fra10ac1: Protein FRA10AC1 homolog (Mus musculus) n=1 Tax=Cotesia congregata TaxID=51543 RepID=A0A8J2HBP5_COTCN|nr:Similar to Fra10ac1: Protein FRA10AC1 homolog (Mus musculus) [Cotesia congregata]
MFPAYVHLSAYDRHKKIINDYFFYKGGSALNLKRDTSRRKTDYDVALRWRTEQEVVVGKGQFECGSKKCKIKEGLKSWEVNFGYEEQGEKKNALVKLRLCSECSDKLNYHSQKKQVHRKKKGLKRLGTTSDKLETQSTASSSTNNQDQDTIIKVEPDEESKEDSGKKEEEIWKNNPSESIEKSREEEFEEYLADLLL